jgi:hypothetical protein
MIRFIYLTVESPPNESGQYPFSLRAFASAAQDRGYSFTINTIFANNRYSDIAIDDRAGEDDISVIILSRGPLQVLSSCLKALISTCDLRHIVVAGEYGFRNFSFWAQQGYIVLLSRAPDVFIKTMEAIQSDMALSGMRGVAYECNGMIEQKAEPQIHETRVSELALLRWPEEKSINTATVSTSYPAAGARFNLKCPNDHVVIRSAGSVINELRSLIDICRPTGIAFVDPGLTISGSRLLSILGFLKENYHGIWSAVLPISFAGEHPDLIREMVSCGLYRVDLIPHSASNTRLLKLDADFTKEELEKDISALISAGTFLTTVNFSFGLPGEDIETLGETIRFGLRILEQAPGRIEVRGEPFDPHGIDIEGSLETSVNFGIGPGSKNPETGPNDYVNVTTGALSGEYMTSKLGSFREDIRDRYSRLVNKVPYELALLHLDLKKFGVTSAWREALLLFPHIYDYSIGYCDHQNTLVTYPLPDLRQLLSCYPMRTIDNFIYSERKNITLDLFLNEIAELDDISSFVFYRCSGDHTVKEIIGSVIEHWKIPEEKRADVVKDVLSFLISLERAFALVLTKIPMI